MIRRSARPLYWVAGLAILCSACEGAPVNSLKAGQDDRMRILERMDVQEAAWNAGDLEGFMSAYWQSDSLLFVGSRGPSRGWTTTLENYRASYPDRATMGQLTFGVEDLTFSGPTCALMLGSWRLDRTGGLDTLSGWFSLVWEKREGDWVIVRDHSS